MNDSIAPLSREKKANLDRELRERGYTRGKLATELLEYCPEYHSVESLRGVINNWARGHRRLPDKLISKIEWLFATSLEQLLSPPASELENEAVDSIRIDFEHGHIEEEQRLILHTFKERFARTVAQKKALALAERGTLICEVCDFDFLRIYGQLGTGFSECHHLTPIAELQEDHSTQLDELAIVCANCHRMLHRSIQSGEMLSIYDLRDLIHERCDT